MKSKLLNQEIIHAKPINLKRITIWTDGSCTGIGPGGWAAVLLYQKRKGEVEHLEISGNELNTTISRMELLAVIKALEVLAEPCKITLFSDSQYVIHAFTKGWIHSWCRRGWVTYPKGEPVKNKDLWLRLIDLNLRHEVTWEWRRGHNKDKWNERADYLAGQQRKKLIKEP